MNTTSKFVFEILSLARINKGSKLKALFTIRINDLITINYCRLFLNSEGEYFFVFPKLLWKGEYKTLIRIGTRQNYRQLYDEILKKVIHYYNT